MQETTAGYAALLVVSFLYIVTADMIHSMTGFGKAEVTYGFRKITVEVRSVNSKQADVSLRIPGDLRYLEMDIRKEVTDTLLRGKIDVYIGIEGTSSEPRVQFNARLAQNYWEQLSKLSENTGIPMLQDPMRTILSLQGVIVPADSSDGESEEDALKHAVMTVLHEALSSHQSFRDQEGRALYDVFVDNIQAISLLLEQTAPYEEERITAVRTRLDEGLKKYIEADYDRNRLEQEMIYYIEKLDINEEKNRLRNHLNYFRETMDKGEVGQGRTLGFIAQEIGREVNTLGSKSNHAELQKIVVKMKDHLEQIKEQVLNVL